MRGYFDTLKVIVLIALRNLFASRLKTLIVGGIILFGSLLVVVGTALVDSVDASMSRSVIGSVAGHIQVYSAKSKDELTVMGGMNMESPDLTPIDDFAALRRTLLGVPNVKAVVPMGLSSAIVTAGNTVDVVLERLRDLARRKLAGEDVGAAYESEKDHVRQIITVLSADMDNVRKIQNEKSISQDDLAAVAKAASEEAWTGFDRNPYPALEFLENRIAPLASDADMLFLRYLGTDGDAFAKSFDRMKIVDASSSAAGRSLRGPGGCLSAVSPHRQAAADHVTRERRDDQVRGQLPAIDQDQLHQRIGQRLREDRGRHQRGPPRHRARQPHRIRLPLPRRRLRRKLLSQGRSGAGGHRAANGLQPRILDAVHAVNNHQKTVLVEKIRRHFDDHLSGLTIAVWGLAFKPGTDDIREARRWS